MWSRPGKSAAAAASHQRAPSVSTTTCLADFMPRPLRPGRARREARRPGPHGTGDFRRQAVELAAGRLGHGGFTRKAGGRLEGHLRADLGQRRPDGRLRLRRRGLPLQQATHRLAYFPAGFLRNLFPKPFFLAPPAVRASRVWRSASAAYSSVSSR
jgi:hypothetical protein